MIAFVGASDSRYIVMEVLSEKGLEFNDLSDKMIRLDDLQTLLLTEDYEQYISDLEFLGAEPREIAALFRKLKEVSTAECIFIAKGFSLDSILIQALRNTGFLKYVSGRTIGVQKEQLAACLDGKDNALELDRVQQIRQIEAEDQPSVTEVKTSRTVAFCGTQARVGTTTQAIQFSKYLQLRGLSVCYIEANENRHVEEIPSLFEIQYRDDHLSLIRFENLDLYYDVFRIAEIYDRKYDVYVFDFGVFPKNNLLPFLEKNMKVVVSGSKPWELNDTMHVLKELQDKEVQYVFNFTERGIREDLLKSMKDKRGNTFFCNYSPNMFSLCAADKPLHDALFEKLGILPQGKKTRGLKGRRKSR